MEKALLILDLDETLVHAGEQLADEPDFYTGPHPVYKRPYLDDFLKRMGEVYKLAIWSSGGALYVNYAVASIFPRDIPLEFVWSSDRCVRKYDWEWRRPLSTKPLKKVQRKGYDLKRTLIVDNDSYKCRSNYGNAIYVHDFLGSKDDQELHWLAHYLESIADHPNYRTLEKRGWRSWAQRDLLKLNNDASNRETDPE